MAIAKKTSSNHDFHPSFCRGLRFEPSPCVPGGAAFAEQEQPREGRSASLEIRILRLQPCTCPASSTHARRSASRRCVQGSCYRPAKQCGISRQIVYPQPSGVIHSTQARVELNVVNLMFQGGDPQMASTVEGEWSVVLQWGNMAKPVSVVDKLKFNRVTWHFIAPASRSRTASARRSMAGCATNFSTRPCSMISITPAPPSHDG